VKLSDWARRYLELLGVEAAPPRLEQLERLTAAHIRRVPFENISSILRRQARANGPVQPLDLEDVLLAWCERRAGGVCFEVAAMVDRLLSELGYQTHPVLAQISFPGSHQANLVELAGHRYLVDVGNGAPFLEPIPLDGLVEVRHAGLAYRFRPSGNDWFQDRWISGKWEPFCAYPLAPPDPEARETAYQRHHTLGQSWVVDALVLTTGSEDEVWSLRDDELRHFTVDGKTQQTLGESDYADLAGQLFGLPGLPIEEARRALGQRVDR
jgi:arylamine N-acetyltransferase